MNDDPMQATLDALASMESGADDLAAKVGDERRAVELEPLTEDDAAALDEPAVP